MTTNQPMLRLPIGVSDFKKLRAGTGTPEAYTFVDKTLLIRDFIFDGSEVILWTRPRRFGKSLNLSMLYYFFSCTEQHKQDLFQGLKIQEAGEQYLAYQGQFPVVFISFKDIKQNSFQHAYEAMAGLMSELFQQHAIVLEQGNLSAKETEIFTSLLHGNAKEIHLSKALQFLSKCLHDYYQKRVIILIDEYDAPLHAADTYDYYPEMIQLVRMLLSTSLKDNIYLHKGGVTGILRVAKEDIFSGLNNLMVNSFLDRDYADYFGFSETDVSALFQRAELATDLAQVQAWYNGYQVRDLTLYNPWSIINCLNQEGELAPYWVNTSDNHLIKKLITGANQAIQKDIKQLIQGEYVEEILNPFLNLKHIKKNRTSILTLLCMSGYLNATPHRDTRGRIRHHLRIPNLEIQYLYEEIIAQWLTADSGTIWLEECMDDLKALRITAFSAKLKQIAFNIFSYHDVKGRTPESFFHGFMLGLTLHCRADYTITSNREAGTGRFDIAMIPKATDSDLPGILFEIKSLPEPEPERDMPELEEAAAQALAQIHEKGYAAVFSEHPDIKQLHMGVAFSGKKLAVVHDLTIQSCG